jgi:hypothetical protein
MPDAPTFPNRRCAVLAAFAVSCAIAVEAGAATAVPWWGQAQSHLEALDDR